MKTLFTAAFAAAVLLAGQAWADDSASKDTKKPVELTAVQMDGVTAGAGNFNRAPQLGGAVPPWSALFDAGAVSQGVSG
ncbi:MAG: hypothetical protein R3316_12720, partial [Rhodovibrionaceae bacterium]|nr:hypothetical protein [Rhodovibrionaceae bacterium]